jgi:hypothetical protein
LLMDLLGFALRFRHTDTCHQHRRIADMRETVLWSGPISQHGCCKRLLYGYKLHVPTEWREQVEGLVVAMKALNAAQTSLLSQEIMKLYRPRTFHRIRRSAIALANKQGKEDRYAETESTDSDSYSTY